MFVVKLTDIVSTFKYAKYVLLSNQKCMTKPTFINLYPNEYNQELHYYSFVFKLDGCIGTFNTLNDLPDKVCVQNKIEDLNITSGGITMNVDMIVKSVMYEKKIIFGILLQVVKTMENI